MSQLPKSIAESQEAAKSKHTKSKGGKHAQIHVEAIEESTKLALAHTSVDAIKGLSAQEILVLQALLRNGNEFGYWCTPNEWAPGEKQALLRVDMRGRILHFLPPSLRSIVEEAVTPAMQESALVIASSSVETRVAISQIMDDALLCLARYLVLIRMGPTGLDRRARNKPLHPKSAMDLAYSYMASLTSIGVAKRVLALLSGDSSAYLEVASRQRSHHTFALVTPDDFSGFSKNIQKHMLLEARRMRVLQSLDLWDDIPSIHEDATPVTRVKGPEKKRDKEPKHEPHLPLPDEYISEMGRRCLWLIRDLAPSLMEVVDKLAAIWLETDDMELTAEYVSQRRHDATRLYLKTYLWRDSRGNIIHRPPFPLRLSQSGKNQRRKTKSSTDQPDSLEDESMWGISNDESDDAQALSGIEHHDADNDNAYDAEKEEQMAMVEVVWPPRTLGEIYGLLHNLQLAHLFVVTLSMGARLTEIVALERTCVEYAPNGMPYANGRTFKLTRRVGGEIRDWVLPDLAVIAIEQQVRLVSKSDAMGPTTPDRTIRNVDAAEPTSSHLWCRSGNGRGSRALPLTALTHALVAFARSIGMETKPGGQNLRMHRLRKTVARLCALALTQAPKILMDVFGHKSIEMTLYYILSDKDLRSEIEIVARELRVMRAKEVIEKIVAAEDTPAAQPVFGGFGGPAAVTMKEAIDAHKARLHQSRKQWGADSVQQLAETLTLQGKAWQLVRPGVICTKFPGTESGPCNKRKGHPEPARCLSHCKHRLEEPFLREDVDNTIRESVDAFIKAVKEGEELMQASWAGQIRANINRFDDLRAKWMENATVQSVCAERVNSEGTV